MEIPRDPEPTSGYAERGVGEEEDGGMTSLAKPGGVLVGATLVFIGSFLTWVTVDVGFATFSSTGTETTDGGLTVVAAVVMFVGGLMLLLRGRAQLAAALVGLVVAGYVTIVRVSEHAGLPGFQVWLTVAAAVVTVVACLVLLFRGRGDVAASLIGVVAAGYAAVVLVNDYMDVRERIANTPGDQASATVGIGVWVVGIGCLISLGVYVWALRGAIRSEAAAA